MRACFLLGLVVVAAGCAGVGTPETQTVAIGLDLAPMPGADLSGPADPGRDMSGATLPHDMAAKPGDDLYVAAGPPDLTPPPVFDLSSSSGCTGHLVINEVKV